MNIRKIYNILVLAMFGFSVISCSDSEDDEVVVTGNCIVFGTIVDGQTNEPLQGASVTLYPSGRTVVTGASGQYEFRNITSSGYLLQVSKADYLSNTQSVTLENGIPAQSDITLTPGSPSLKVLFGELFFMNVRMSPN